MAITSTLTTQDVLRTGLRVSNASLEDVAFYDRAAYRRMDQLTKGSQDEILTVTLFPKATIELLTMLEFVWWPVYAANKGLAASKVNLDGKLVTAFDPSKLLKMNQTLIQLEVYKAVELFYSTVVTDSANVNEKDAVNHEYAAKRFQTEWNKAKVGSYFYDADVDGTVDDTEENAGLGDVYDADRRYF